MITWYILVQICFGAKIKAPDQATRYMFWCKNKQNKKKKKMFPFSGGMSIAAHGENGALVKRLTGGLSVVMHFCFNYSSSSSFETLSLW